MIDNKLFFDDLELHLKESGNVIVNPYCKKRFGNSTPLKNRLVFSSNGIYSKLNPLDSTTEMLLEFLHWV